MRKHFPSHLSCLLCHDRSGLVCRLFPSPRVSQSHFGRQLPSGSVRNVYAAHARPAALVHMPVGRVSLGITMHPFLGRQAS